MLRRLSPHPSNNSYSLQVFIFECKTHEWIIPRNTVQIICRNFSDDVHVLFGCQCQLCEYVLCLGNVWQWFFWNVSTKRSWAKTKNMVDSFFLRVLCAFYCLELYCQKVHSNPMTISHNLINSKIWIFKTSQFLGTPTRTKRKHKSHIFSTRWELTALSKK